MKISSYLQIFSINCQDFGGLEVLNLILIYQKKNFLETFEDIFDFLRNALTQIIFWNGLQVSAFLLCHFMAKSYQDSPSKHSA